MSRRPPSGVGYPARLVGSVEVSQTVEEVGGILGQLRRSSTPTTALRDTRLAEPTMRHDGSGAGWDRQRFGRFEARLCVCQVIARQRDFAEVFAHVGFGDRVFEAH